MTDIMSRDKRSRLMSAVLGRGNQSTELALIALFRSWRIIGWHRHKRIAGCCPDFVFPRSRVAVFADGCFWHGCPRHYTKPAVRVGYWRSKVEDNRSRDKRAARRLRSRGWSVWRVWECTIRSARLPTRLLRQLERARGASNGRRVEATFMRLPHKASRVRRQFRHADLPKRSRRNSRRNV